MFSHFHIIFLYLKNLLYALCYVTFALDENVNINQGQESTREMWISQDKIEIVESFILQRGEVVSNDKVHSFNDSCMQQCYCNSSLGCSMQNATRWYSDLTVDNKFTGFS